MNPSRVVIAQAEQAEYPRLSPFHPDQAYPEFPGQTVGQEVNHVYRAVREALRLSGLDAARFGTSAWNPLATYVKPGQFVLLKPNFVKEVHPRDPRGWIYTVTHASVIRAVADYVWKALEGRGKVVVGDAPQTDSSFAKLVELLQLQPLRNHYQLLGQSLDLVDMRKEEWTNVEEVIVDRRALAGDPHGYLAFDLAEQSEFANHGGAGRYYGADYDDSEVNRHHSGGRHEYMISGSAIHCDVFINLPKLKTHKKAGVTVNLKNLVGVNGDKNWLPHHTTGSPRTGGDQYPEMTTRRRIEHHTVQTLRKVALAVPGVGSWMLRRARKAGKRVFGDNDQVIRSGNWYGNDTTWRMCLDLNKIVLYGNTDGSLRPPSGARKTYLSFVDGLIGGQGNGPMDPDPLDSGVILFGTDPGCVDAVSASLMGFDVEKIPIVRNAFRSRGYAISGGTWQAIEVVSNRPEWTGTCAALGTSPHALQVEPHFGWVNHIEATPR